MKLRLLESRRSRRACGECRACCTTCAVHEIDKPVNTPCQHLCERGCAIYESRPNSCRIYDCAWLQGYFSEKQRPDQCGIVWTFERVPEYTEGLLAHAMLLNEQVPMERVEYMFTALRQQHRESLILQIIPHDVRAPARANIQTRRLRPGVFLAISDPSMSG